MYINQLLGFLKSVYSSELGGKSYGTSSPVNLLITFPLDVVQIDFLKHLQQRSKIILHVFMEKAKYNSRDIGTSLDDYIPLMNFKVIE